ncbi:MAG: TolC family protein [Bacillota bacterium]|jgi:outer membrane protein TolC
MMKALIKIFSILLGTVIFFSAAPALAQELPEAIEITLAEAIESTLENNIDLKLLEKQIDARKLDRDMANFYSKKLQDVDEKIQDAWRELREKKAEVEQLKRSGMWDLLPETERRKIESGISSAEAELRASSQYRINSLEDAQVTELYQTQAYLGLNVTLLGYEIAGEKYALLARQKYYDVLKAQRMVAVKEMAVKRAEAQAKMARDSFEAGFRAKDDMLMAEAQCSLLKADLANAQNDLELALIELKKVMFIDLDTPIKPVDDFSQVTAVPDLALGLKKALENRVEIQKADMELTVAQINMELANRYTTSNTFDYRQIKLQLENAELTQIQQKQLVEAEVRASYQTMLAIKNMLDQVKNSAAQAKEALEIAMYRYQEGYGIPTSVLKSFNMEDAGGTIFEVLAAQEKLSEVEEKVVEITYGYNLAKTKYETDICYHLWASASEEKEG